MIATRVSSEPATVFAEVSSDRVTRVLLVILAAAVTAVYWPTIRVTAELIGTGDDMAHGLFAPIVAGIVAWEKRTVFARGAATSAWGLPVLLIAGLLALAANLGGSTTFARFACLISATGYVLLAGSWHGLRTMAFPLMLLLFTFPIPQVLYGEITLPLQLLASRLSELAFEILGYSVLREGNILQLPHQRLSVVEACSGLRSLITLAFFTLVYAYFLERSKRVRFVLVLAVVPAAILMNVVRIVVTGLLGKHAPEYTRGVYHDVLGWSCFGVGFLLIFLLHRTISRIWAPRAGV